MMDIEEVIQKLRELSYDKEDAHEQADQLLLEAVDARVREAYIKAKDDRGGWWFA